MNPAPRDNRKPVPLTHMAPLMRHELRRFNLTDRERTLASLILSLSWEQDIPAVRIPQLDIFERLTGLAANHVSETLYDLEKLMRVIQVGEMGGDKTYNLNPRTETWQAKPRVSRATLLETMNIVNELNGVARHSEDQLNFKFQVVANFLSTKTPDLGVIPKKEYAL